jgi:hypothetical protein
MVSMRVFASASAIVLIVGVSPAGAQQPDHTLLPTATLAREIGRLQGPKADARIDVDALKVRVASMRQVVGNFIVRQIQAYPSISKEDLQKQLGSAFASSNGWISGPRVFAEPSGPKTTHRDFAITYGWFGFYGKGGSETIIESYVWDQGRRALLGAGMVPPFFSGFLTEQEEVCWFSNPNTYWILVSGEVGGASGRVLGGSAAVVEISAEHVKTVWTAPSGIGNVNAYVPSSSFPRWELEYVDAKRFYSGLPNARLLDVYQIAYDKRTFRRLIHQPLD